MPFEGLQDGPVPQPRDDRFSPVAGTGLGRGRSGGRRDKLDRVVPKRRLTAGESRGSRRIVAILLLAVVAGATVGEAAVSAEAADLAVPASR